MVFRAIFIFNYRSPKVSRIKWYANRKPCGAIKLLNTMLLYARLNESSFYYVEKYTPTVFTILSIYLIADVKKNHSKIFYLDFIQALIRSKATNRMFVILDKKFSYFWHKLSQHFGSSLRLSKCLCGTDFGG